MNKLLWLTDLHMEKADGAVKTRFYKDLSEMEFDAAVVTGDISNAAELPGELMALAKACAPRQVYFLLGNHDFFGSSFYEVDAAVEAVCRKHDNLHHLGHGEIIRLSAQACLIGHRGWADARAGYGKRTHVSPRDSNAIGDFKDLSQEEVFERMENLGRESGRYFREVLPYALSCYDHVWIATHVPPFKWSAFYDGRMCGPLHLPHYTNVSAGGAIHGIAAQYPNKRVTVLCGHTHSPVLFRASDHFEVRTGRATPGRPQVQAVFEKLGA